MDASISKRLWRTHSNHSSSLTRAVTNDSSGQVDFWFLKARFLTHEPTHGDHNPLGSCLLPLETAMTKQTAIKKAIEGHFESEMAYGWASDATAWEAIYAKAAWSVQYAKAALVLVESMEKAGVAELPRAGSLMRGAARIAHKTLREHEMGTAIKSVRSRKKLRK
jgi:hypothetical protein